MKRNSRIIGAVLVFAAICTVAVVAVSCTRDRSLARLREAGVVRVGYAVEAPYAFVGANCQVTGEFPEAAKYLAARLGIRRVEWVQTDFDALIPDLESGRFDLIAAGMFITPQRAKRIAFSEPLLRVRQGLLVRRGNPRQLHAYRDVLTRPGIRIAVLAGSFEETLLRQMKVPERQIVSVPDALTGRLAVESGVADGLALSQPTLRWMVDRAASGRTALAEPFEQPTPAQMKGSSYCAFGFRKEDHQLLDAWNKALHPFVDSPEHLALLSRFGFGRLALPGTITTSEVLVR
ncbi:ectoine/hydroxyectoine ABC transporter substrate-binding protein EhuB [Geotalea uraniireducens]|uniref:Ectoine/hydroxyectoine ABC transporter substrate-binding protein EhuB n=1 Tax=Geotalea uraniireducens TaxID=351604 RepID=A0ABM8EKZ3_9BACT|nr:ectoine/hydroxyectoine ABC transporter substrate-binding protein EhuB [Geotalea uraniireducens]BDV42995.1 ectoine/hydroxyectoine ABC transporter substrate-binding protein EhuB [Geotalea uraniireducens]